MTDTISNNPIDRAELDHFPKPNETMVWQWRQTLISILHSKSYLYEGHANVIRDENSEYVNDTIQLLKEMIHYFENKEKQHD